METNYRVFDLGRSSVLTDIPNYYLSCAPVSCRCIEKGPTGLAGGHVDNNKSLIGASAALYPTNFTGDAYSKGRHSLLHYYVMTEQTEVVKLWQRLELD